MSSTPTLHRLRYPVGEFTLAGPLDAAGREAAVQAIESTPARLRAAVSGLSDAQLDTPYRPGGWTVRQVVHHLPDSHANSYIRLKLALAEDVPTIRTYDEAVWAGLPDTTAPIAMSLQFLEALHLRWVYLWRRLTDDQWARRFRHPEFGEMRVDALASMYAWHGAHHVAHITTLRTREGWDEA
jgi:hypothetical protein